VAAKKIVLIVHRPPVTIQIIEVQPLMTVEKVRERATVAKANGASRLCMGAAWREVRR
jgi:biotin synthase-like enzyme